MPVAIRPEDLRYSYLDTSQDKGRTVFKGKPDRGYFDRHELSEVIAMLEAVLDQLGCRDLTELPRLEEILHRVLPRDISRREEVFDSLVGAMRELRQF